MPSDELSDHGAGLTFDSGELLPWLWSKIQAPESKWQHDLYSMNSTPMSSSSSSSSPPLAAATPATSSHHHSPIDGEEEQYKLGISRGFIFGPAPSVKEAEDAISILEQMVASLTLSQVLRDRFVHNLDDEDRVGQIPASIELLVHGLCLSGDPDGALELFDEMRVRGVKPNVVTYSALVDGLCKGGRVMKAMEVVERIAMDKCNPNVITYSGLVDGLCREGRVREAMEMLDRMRIQGRKPDAGLCGKVINGLCDSGKFHEAANCLDEMVLSGVQPNRVTWSLHVRMHNVVVRGLCGESDANRAFQVYLSMRSRGINTEPETFQLLIDCLCKKDDLQRAAQLVYEMLVGGCS